MTVISEALWFNIYNCRYCYNLFSHILPSIVETVVGKTRSCFVVEAAVAVAVAVAEDCN